MCGIFGAVGNWDEGSVRALAIANRERGKDSLGFFDSSGQMIKGAGDPLAVVSQQHVASWLQGVRKKSEAVMPKGWFIAGHTRLGTRGAAIRRNAHPFRYGKTIGAHNGMVDAPRDYEVDSMYLFDLLDKYKGDYNQAFAEVTGYWGLSWFDGTDFFLQSHDGELSVVFTDDCWYYSSDSTHLKACVPCDHTTIQTFGEGTTWKFSADGKVTDIDPFVSTAPQYWTKGNDYTSYYGKGSSSKYSSSDNMGGDDKWWNDSEYSATNDEVRDFDSDWRQAWSDYTNESEHSKV